MVLRDDERRKFEAWAKQDTGTFGRWLLQDLSREHAGEYQSSFTAAAWHGWLARAEQAETPRAAEPTCKQCGFKQTDAIHFDPKYEFRHYYIEGVYVPSPIQHTKAAAPVEDRPDKICDKCGQVHMEGICCVEDHPAPTQENSKENH